MKKIICILLSLFLCLTCFVGCPAKKNEETIKILYLSGPTGLGLGAILSGKIQNISLSYSPNMYNSPSDITAEIMAGRFDIACLPVNLAVNLYNKGIDLKIGAINTLGVLYILENGEMIEDLSSLEGKTILTAERGSMPEYILQYILDENNISAKIEFLSSFDEVATEVINNQGTIVMLPEPKATATIIKSGGTVRSAISLTDEWNKINPTTLAQGCIIFSQNFIESGKAETFLSDYKASIEFMSNPDNIDLASEYAVNANILPSLAIAKSSIPKSNIIYIDGNEMKDILNGVYGILNIANPDSIGGKLPDNNIYYILNNDSAEDDTDIEKFPNV